MKTSLIHNAKFFFQEKVFWKFRTFYLKPTPSKKRTQYMCFIVYVWDVLHPSTTKTLVRATAWESNKKLCYVTKYSYPFSWTGHHKSIKKPSEVVTGCPAHNILYIFTRLCKINGVFRVCDINVWCYFGLHKSLVLMGEEKFVVRHWRVVSSCR